MLGFVVGSCGFLRVKSRLDDFMICGNPIRSSRISNMRAMRANAPAVTIGTPSKPSIPVIPISCIPSPAGITGMNASAVTSGCIKKNATHGTFIPKAKPKNHHSNPFKIQHINVKASISGMAFLVLCALSLYSSSLPIKPPVNFFMKRIFAILLNMVMAFFDQVKSASTVAPRSIKPMAKPAINMPTFIPASVCGNISFHVVVGTNFTR